MYSAASSDTPQALPSPSVTPRTHIRNTYLPVTAATHYGKLNQPARSQCTRAFASDSSFRSNQGLQQRSSTTSLPPGHIASWPRPVTMHHSSMNPQLPRELPCMRCKRKAHAGRVLRQW